MTKKFGPWHGGPDISVKEEQEHLAELEALRQKKITEKDNPGFKVVETEQELFEYLDELFHKGP